MFRFLTCSCSCTGNPQNTSIQNSTNLTYVESNSEDDGDQHDGEANDTDDELYTTTFAITSLSNCKQKSVIEKYTKINIMMHHATF
jgi:hypothetical protein